MNVLIAGLSNRGRIRLNNEDNFFINGSFKSDVMIQNFSCESMVQCSIHVLAVCDGMGGESKGELASLRAVELLNQMSAENLYSIPSDYIQQANRLICNEIEKNNRQRMGTTASVLMIKDNKCRICHIGDSRIYRLRDQNLMQLTKDHTRVQQMIDAGIIKKEDAGKSRKKHVLTQHLGIFPSEFLIEPQVIIDEKVLSGDLYLLCSDGLTDMLTDKEIESLLLCSESVTQIATTLIQAALEYGGKDNVTVVVVKII